MAEATSDTKHSDKCAHDGCKCTVQPDVQYCSDHCAQASRSNSGSGGQHDQCGCAHAACS